MTKSRYHGTIISGFARDDPSFIVIGQFKKGTHTMGNMGWRIALAALLVAVLLSGSLMFGATHAVMAGHIHAMCQDNNVVCIGQTHPVFHT